MILNRRRQAILRDGRYGLCCHLCGHMDYEDQLDSLDRTHCVDCELLLWDSTHMVENDNGSRLGPCRRNGAKPRFTVVRSGS